MIAEGSGMRRARLEVERGNSSGPTRRSTVSGPTTLEDPDPANMSFGTSATISWCAPGGCASSAPKPKAPGEGAGVPRATTRAVPRSASQGDPAPNLRVDHFASIASMWLLGLAMRDGAVQDDGCPDE